MTASVSLLMGVALAALLVSAIAVDRMRVFALRAQMLDLPGQRRNHAQPTPRGGGVGVVAGALLPLSLLLSHTTWAGSLLTVYVLAVLMVALVGWIDDRRGVSAAIRLCVQMVAATLFVVTLWHVQGEALASFAVVGVWLLVVGLANAWNFMDGINGIAASQAVLVAAVLAVMWYPVLPWSMAAVALAAACAAFVPFNLPHARIFLGDVGSVPIGFMLAALIGISVAAGRLQWPMALVLVSAFGIDSALTLGQRIVRGKRWWRAHREHTYQWLVRAGLPHWQVTALYGGWTLASIALIQVAPTGMPGLLLAALWLSVGMVCWALLRTWVLHAVERKPR